MIKALKVLLASIVIAAISIGLAEIALRVLFDRYDPDQSLRFVRQAAGFRLAEPGTVVRHWKNTGDFDVEVRINDAGFRDAKDLRRSTVEDWFVVGDSYGFGFGVAVESRFSNRLERITGGPVYNISIPNDLAGYEQLVDHARTRGAQIGRLIVAVCMENDILPYPEGASPRSRDGAGDPPRRLSFNLGRAKAYLTDNSALYKAATALAHQLPLLRKASVDLGLIRENLAGIPRMGYSAEAVERSAARAHRLATTAGIDDALFLIVPSRGLWLDDLRETHHAIHTSFVAALEARGLDVVDPRSEFERGGDPLSFHFENDGHWNAAGHEVAARLIAERLAAR